LLGQTLRYRQRIGQSKVLSNSKPKFDSYLFRST
jgi:hypothetical protein